MLFISHDLAVVRMLADRVCVLFRGELMEIGRRDQVFSRALPPLYAQPAAGGAGAAASRIRSGVERR